MVYLVMALKLYTYISKKKNNNYESKTINLNIIYILSYIIIKNIIRIVCIYRYNINMYEKYTYFYIFIIKNTF